MIAFKWFLSTMNYLMSIKKVFLTETLTPIVHNHCAEMFFSPELINARLAIIECTLKLYLPTLIKSKGVFSSVFHNVEFRDSKIIHQLWAEWTSKFTRSIPNIFILGNLVWLLRLRFTYKGNFSSLGSGGSFRSHRSFPWVQCQTLLFKLHLP